MLLYSSSPKIKKTFFFDKQKLFKALFPVIIKKNGLRIEQTENT